MKPLTTTPTVLTKIRLDSLSDMNKDSSLLETQFKIVLTIVPPIHHAIFSKPMLSMKLMVLAMVSADFSIPELLVASPEKPLV